MTEKTVQKRTPALGAQTLLQQHYCSADLKSAITKFAKQQARASTHHIILATHRPMTMHEARYLLKKWDKLMNGQILGGRWNRKPHLHCEWVAFPEHVHSDPHWHLLWRMSRDLEEATVRKMLNGRFIDGPKYGGRIKGQLVHGLDWIVHRHWQRVIRSGTSKVVPIFESEKLGYYVTKGQRDAVAFDNMVMSGEFKTCLPKAA